MSDLVTGRRLVAKDGESGHALWKQLAIDRIGHNYAVHWSVQNVDQSYVGSAWALEQTAVLGPTITQIKDVPNDQGGHVELTIQKSPFDVSSRTTYAAHDYYVWRRAPSLLAATVDREGVALDPAVADARVVATRGLSVVEWNGRPFARSPGIDVANPFPPGTWGLVATFLASQSGTYVVTTTTLARLGRHEALTTTPSSSA